MDLQRIKVLPRLKKNAIEDAVSSFIKDSRVTGVDEIGMFNQTIETIAQATMFSTNDASHFWLAHNDREVMAYVLGHIGKDIDNKLTYTLSQAWVHPSLRGKKIVKVWWEKLRAEAKRCMCKHVVLPVSRHVKPYIRFVGKQYHEYVTLIKEDL